MSCWAAAALLLGAALLSGRLLVGSLGGRLLAGLRPESAAASLLLGVAAWTVAFARLSGAGFTAPEALRVILLLHGLLLGLLLQRGRLAVLVPEGRLTTWLGLAGSLVLAVTVALFPVLRTGGLAINNDTFTYCALSEWLQEHAIGTPARWEADSPLTYLPAIWQDTNVTERDVREAPTLGAAFDLALVQAATGATPSLSAFPATASFGMALATAGVWLLGRWAARLGTLPSLLAAGAFAVLPHPLFWGHHNGFLQQTYGIAALLLGVSLLSRFSSRPRLEPAAWAALAAAFLLIVYLPLLPFLAVVAGWLALLWTRAAPSRSRLAAVGPLAFGCALVAGLAWREIGHGLWRLPHLARIVAGWHVEMTGRDFLAYATGASGEGIPFGPLSHPLLRETFLWMGPFWAGLALVGAVSISGRARTGGILSLLGLFSAGFLYFRFFATDPWTGEIGHTWSLFRLAQWAYPLVLVCEIAGLARLARGVPRRVAPGLLAVAIVPLCLLPAHWSWSYPLGLGMRRIVASQSPLRDLPDLKKQFAALPPGTLLFVGRAANRHLWLGAYTSLLAYPRRIVGDWEGSAGVHAAPGPDLYGRMLARVGEPGIVPIVGGIRLAGNPELSSLGGGFARILSLETPLVLYLTSPVNRLAPSPTALPGFELGEGRAKIVVLAGARGSVDLTLRAASDRAQPGRPPVLDVFAFPSDVTHPVPRGLIEQAAPLGELRLDEGRVWSVPVSLEAGLNTVVLSPERRETAGEERTFSRSMESVIVSPVAERLPPPPPALRRPDRGQH